MPSNQGQVQEDGRERGKEKQLDRAKIFGNK